MENNQNKHAAVLAAITALVGKMLKEQGGYNNGFRTYVKGIVSVDTHADLKWSTPKIDEMTGKEVSNFGGKLNDAVIEVLEEHGIDEVEFHAELLNHGSYHTTVSIVETQAISIPL